MTGAEIKETQEEVEETSTTPEETDQSSTVDNEGELKDKHGQDAISKGKYNRDMAAKDAEIAELRKQVEAASKSEESRKELEGKISALEESLAAQKVDHALESAGCVDNKAARARLDEFDGDVAKLKEACPYLFRKEEKGSTGFKPKGSPKASLNSKINKAMGLEP